MNNEIILRIFMMINLTAVPAVVAGTIDLTIR